MVVRGALHTYLHTYTRRPSGVVVNLAISLDIVQICEFDSRHDNSFSSGFRSGKRETASKKSSPSVDDDAIKIRRREYKQNKNKINHT